MDFAKILDEWEARNKLRMKSGFTNGQKKIAEKQNDGKKKSANYIVKNQKEQKSSVNPEKAQEKRINPTELWLRRFGTVDKDSMRDEENERKKARSPSYFSNLRCDDEIDLHGLTAEEATKRLEIFVSECEKRRLKKIMIVHGKGIHTKGAAPVLGDTVRRFIENDRRLGRSGHPDERHGGRGSTWVILKNNL